MSDLVVKEWRPVEGCESCRQAAKLFHEHTGIATHTNSLAVKRIRELEDENSRLKSDFKDIAFLEAENARLSHLHKLDHSLADQWLVKAEFAEAQEALQWQEAVERLRAEHEAAIKAAVEEEREAIIKWLLDYGWFDELDLIAVNAIKAIRARGGE